MIVKINWTNAFCLNDSIIIYIISMCPTCQLRKMMGKNEDWKIKIHTKGLRYSPQSEETMLR